MADSGIYFHESYLINIFKIMRNGGYNETVLAKKKNEIVRINKICEDLFCKDYILQLINNFTEVLCPHYPPNILIPYQRIPTDIEAPSSYMPANSIILQGINKSINARCRNRFAVPSLTFKNRFLCRSSTLSGTFEIYGRQYMNSFLGGYAETSSSGYNNGQPKSGKEAFDQIRGDDMILLETLKIKYIFDLMLENKKMMFGLPVSSSEKIDRHNRYKEFNIICLPYPGCEFFNDWRKSNYQMEGLQFSWNNVEITSAFQFPNLYKPSMANAIKWDDYRNWDLTVLTTNYLKLILGIIVEDDYSILIHCISGWDRTPLFISLIRCMLWADGFVHQSLSPQQMLYLTLAYDWYLFGHQTKKRLEAGEEILKFTFAFLNYIARDPSTSINHVYNEFIYSLINIDVDNQMSHEDHLNLRLKQRTERLETLAFHFDVMYNQELSVIVNKSSSKGTKSFIYSASSLVNGLFSGSESRSANKPS